MSDFGDLFNAAIEDANLLVLFIPSADRVMYRINFPPEPRA
jgi:hypothetical protein